MMSLMTSPNVTMRFQNPQVKKITSLSKPNTRIGGAYFTAPAHGVDTGDSLYHPRLNGGWYELLSLVMALLRAEK